LLQESSYIPPIWLPNGHFQTIYPSFFRRLLPVQYQRERILTQDGDFLDLDWSGHQSDHGIASKKLVILSHGLEGSSQSQYIQGMVQYLNEAGYDCLAWNFRSCSGEMNARLKFYHSGATEDLQEVIDRALQKSYTHIHLIGFSLGGNLTLKYLGERGSALPTQIASTVVFSVPLDLRACSLEMMKRANQVYMHRFLKSLKPKIIQKSIQFPDQIDLKRFADVKTLYDFDDIYTAGLHGFEHADHYYESCSAVNFISNITIPTLIVNAMNDPIVPFKSLPMDEIANLKFVYLENPKDGGHCGFRPIQLKKNVYWSEERALAFINKDFSHL
jgi:predicted alpha/beta-fold hydrolase